MNEKTKTAPTFASGSSGGSSPSKSRKSGKRTARERDVENYFAKRVKERGGISYKFLPSVSGLPDRVVLRPDGRVCFVELKAPRGTLRPIQKIRHAEMRRYGAAIFVIRSKPEVDFWIGELFGDA